MPYQLPYPSLNFSQAGLQVRRLTYFNTLLFPPIAALRLGRRVLGREGGDDDTNARVPEGPGDVLKNFIEGARYFFVRTRWDRTGYIPR